MEQSLDFKITTKSLFKYALPTILSSVFMNIYSMHSGRSIWKINYKSAS